MGTNLDIKEYHIVPRYDGWALTRKGLVRAIRHFKTYELAVTEGIISAQRKDGILYIHERSGKIIFARTFIKPLTK